MADLTTGDRPMRVMDIVTRAVMNAGIVPSFNPDEVPEDIQARASDVLRNELIPQPEDDETVKPRAALLDMLRARRKEERDGEE